MAAEALEDQLSVNPALPRTLHGLLFRPGFLTREYLAGRIARYIPPFRLFLVTSLLFFALFPVLTSVGQFAEDAVERGAREADAARTKDNQNVENVNFGIDTTRLPNWLRPITRPVIRQEDRLNRMETRQVGRELLAGLARNVPRAVFLLLPIFALILKLLYLRQKRLYVGHFVFALHVHAFAFLLFTLALIMNNSLFRALLALWLLVYLFWAMKRVYEQSVPVTALKYVGLSLGYLVVLNVVLAGVAVLTLLTLKGTEQLPPWGYLGCATSSLPSSTSPQGRNCRYHAVACALSHSTRLGTHTPSLHAIRTGTHPCDRESTSACLRHRRGVPTGGEYVCLQPASV